MKINPFLICRVLEVVPEMKLLEMLAAGSLLAASHNLSGRRAGGLIPGHSTGTRYRRNTHPPRDLAKENERSAAERALTTMCGKWGRISFVVIVQ